MPAEHLSKRIGEHPSTFFPPPVTSNSPQLPLTAVQSRSRASHLKYSVANTVSTPPQRLRRLSCSQISACQLVSLSRRSRAVVAQREGGPLTPAFYRSAGEIKRSCNCLFTRMKRFHFFFTVIKTIPLGRVSVSRPHALLSLTPTAFSPSASTESKSMPIPPSPTLLRAGCLQKRSERSIF